MELLIINNKAKISSKSIINSVQKINKQTYTMEMILKRNIKLLNNYNKQFLDQCIMYILFKPQVSITVKKIISQ